MSVCKCNEKAGCIAGEKLSSENAKLIDENYWLHVELDRLREELIKVRNRKTGRYLLGKFLSVFRSKV